MYRVDFLTAQHCKARHLLSECLFVRPSVCLSVTLVSHAKFRNTEFRDSTRKSAFTQRKLDR